MEAIQELGSTVGENIARRWTRREQWRWMRRTRVGQCGTGSRRNYGKRAAHVWDFVFLLARHSLMMEGY